MKLTKEAFNQIRQFAKQRIGGFGMSLELAEKMFWDGSEHIYNYNLLTPHVPGTRDLHDFISWADCKTLDIDLVNGFAWLDFHVSDREQLRDYVHALIDENGNVVKLWQTWANEKELSEFTKMEIA